MTNISVFANTPSVSQWAVNKKYIYINLWKINFWDNLLESGSWLSLLKYQKVCSCNKTVNFSQLVLI